MHSFFFCLLFYLILSPSWRSNKVNFKIFPFTLKLFDLPNMPRCHRPLRLLFTSIRPSAPRWTLKIRRNLLSKWCQEVGCIHFPRGNQTTEVTSSATLVICQNKNYHTFNICFGNQTDIQVVVTKTYLDFMKIPCLLKHF